MYQRRHFCRGGENECKTTLFVTGTSSNLLTCINVLFFGLHIYCQVTCPKNTGQTEKKVSLRHSSLYSSHLILLLATGLRHS